METKTNTIHYGFGKDYLPNWGMAQALREIYQNFLDYGNYNESVVEDGDNVLVEVDNDWLPESLDFLRIGKSGKRNSDSIGKHGEGLKMAFLILKREGYDSFIYAGKYTVEPSFYIDSEIGECFCLNYNMPEIQYNGFKIVFSIKKDLFNQFKENVIKKEDVLFSNFYGDVVDKPIGNIYSGGLFVTKCENMSNAYNINPSFLPLDRDRSVPRSFDVSYYSSKINSDYEQKITLSTLSCSDAVYIDKVPDSVKQQITPKPIGNTIEFTYKGEDGEDVVISNESVKEILKKDSFFSAAIKKIKHFMAKQLGLYDLLIEFKEKHVYSAEAAADFDLILERVKPD